ncbi:MAG: transposase [Synergistaceae bacterium]|nr:transposase [Synergistaceae bacterium]
MPVRIIITSRTIADSTQVPQLIQGINAKSLLADRGYDTNNVLEAVKEAGMEVVIPPKRNRHEQRYYEFRHIVENTFFRVETLAWNSDAICKKYVNMFSIGTNLLYGNVA